MTLPSPPSLSARPKTSGLAVASLILGCCSFVFCLLTAIPAVIFGHIAKSKIRNSQGTLAGEGLALAGLIMGYVLTGLSLVVLPLMLSVAVPNFMKARTAAQRHACEFNLKTIQSAKEAWKVEHNKSETDTPADSHLFGEDKTIRQKPACPAGGVYSVNAVGTPATCSIPTHTLTQAEP